jgi:hypothetical protein
MFIPDDRDRQNCPFGSNFLDISQNYGGCNTPTPL